MIKCVAITVNKLDLDVSIQIIEKLQRDICLTKHLYHDAV